MSLIEHMIKSGWTIAQPEINCSEIPNNSDTISRQAAIDAIMGQPPEPHYPSWYAKQIKDLPSAQSDTSRIENILHGKSAEEQYDFLHWIMCTYAMQFTDSREAVIAWLGGAEGDEG